MDGEYVLRCRFIYLQKVWTNIKQDQGPYYFNSQSVVKQNAFYVSIIMLLLLLLLLLLLFYSSIIEDI